MASRGGTDHKVNSRLGVTNTGRRLRQRIVISGGLGGHSCQESGSRGPGNGLTDVLRARRKEDGVFSRSKVSGGLCKARFVSLRPERNRRLTHREPRGIKERTSEELLSEVETPCAETEQVV